MTGIKCAYARTAASQLSYWPGLAREPRLADVVHVFSAFYLSFYNRLQEGHPAWAPA